ncbi:hypothetical protein [Frankia nepalensis]|uniref:hypothetical protein n=1 Tax=Frankia nepalensis TaxID=1836974 RepID=UPI001EE3D1EB|nr:hypothetical protein [Frankia nepalensis]
MTGPDRWVGPEFTGPPSGSGRADQEEGADGAAAGVAAPHTGVAELGGAPGSRGGCWPADTSYPDTPYPAASYPDAPGVAGDGPAAAGAAAVSPARRVPARPAGPWVPAGSENTVVCREAGWLTGGVAGSKAVTDSPALSGDRWVAVPQGSLTANGSTACSARHWDAAAGAAWAVGSVAPTRSTAKKSSWLAARTCQLDEADAGAPGTTGLAGWRA